MRNGWRLSALVMVLMPLWARSDVPVPPAAFWEYLEDFGERDGEIFDPLDLTDAEQLVRGQTATDQPPNTPTQEESRP